MTITRPFTIRRRPPPQPKCNLWCQQPMKHIRTQPHQSRPFWLLISFARGATADAPRSIVSSQVKLDVDRSLWRFPKGIGHPERIQLRRGITDVLDAILGPNPHLHYYQGFHEICAVFMLTCGGRSGLELLRILCRCDQPACSLSFCVLSPPLLVLMSLPCYISTDLHGQKLFGSGSLNTSDG